MKLLFIFNQHSGKGLIKSHLADIIDIMVKEGYEVTAYATQSQGDAIDKVQEWAEKYDKIVCSGGDGTLDEVITGLMKCGIKVPVGYIPAGSTNDFGNSLGIDKDMIRSAEIAVRGNNFPCDIGQFADDYFVYVAAFGIFTEVSYKTSQSLKNVFGHAAYILEGVKNVTNVPSFKMRVETENGVIEDQFIYGMITNSVSVGGFKGIVPAEVELNDGLFEATLIKSPQNAFQLNDILACLGGLKSESEYIYSFQTKQLTVCCEEEIPWTLDGEYGGDHKEVTIRNCNKAIDIMVE